MTAAIVLERDVIVGGGDRDNNTMIRSRRSQGGGDQSKKDTRSVLCFIERRAKRPWHSLGDEFELGTKVLVLFR